MRGPELAGTGRDRASSSLPGPGSARGLAGRMAAGPGTDSLPVQTIGVSLTSMKLGITRHWMPGLLLAAALGATPAYAFRCGTQLVHEGDTRAQVIAKCGEPVEIDRRSVWRRPLVWLRGRPVFLGSDLVEIPVELWTYNLGPNKLMRRIRFEDGRVVEIETLGYGYLDG